MDGLELDEGTPTRDEAVADLDEKLKALVSAYEIDTKVLEALVRKGDVEQAEQKLVDIRKKFPRHPNLDQLERLTTEGVSENG
jgi:hypothetical protein